MAIASAIVGFFAAPMAWLWRLVFAIAGLLLIAPSSSSDLIALVSAVPLLLWRIRRF